MSQKVSDAVARLKKAIDGKTRTDEWRGRVHTCSYAEVSPLDVIEVATALPDLPLAVNLRKGSENVLDFNPPVHFVTVKVVNLADLIEAAEKLGLPPTTIVTHAEPAISPPATVSADQSAAHPAS